MTSNAEAFYSKCPDVFLTRARENKFRRGELKICGGIQFANNPYELPPKDVSSSCGIRRQWWQGGGRTPTTRYFMIYKELTYGNGSARSSPCIYGNFRNLHPIYQRHVILVSPLLIHSFPVDSYDR